MESLLRAETCTYNRLLPTARLVELTWGNASAMSADRKHVYIKPSGVDYATLAPEHICKLSFPDGALQGGELKPSTDTIIHLHLYRAFAEVYGIIHTHSPWATIFAQSGKSIPVLGTTHADCFRTEIPCTAALTQEEIATPEYEINVAKSIVRVFEHFDCRETGAVLVRHHGVFVWGRTLAQAYENAVTVEQCAFMAWHSLQLGLADIIPPSLVDRHFFRKHGATAYYGQHA